MTWTYDESFPDTFPGDHGVSRIRINDNEQWAEITCRCGWDMMAGSVSELFDEYLEHRVEVAK